MSAFSIPSELVSVSSRDDIESFDTQKNGVFKFKYVPVQHFQEIVKKVRRNRAKKEEEYVWASFVKHNSLANGDGKVDSAESNNSMRSRGKSLSKIDTELKRLEEDTAPEKDKGVRSNAEKNRELAPVNEKKSVPVTTGNEEVSPGCEVEKHFLSDEKIYFEYNRRSQPKSVDGDSGSRTNTARGAAAMGVIYTKPNPQATYKILMMQRRVIELLHEISSRLSRIPSPDSDHDLKRRQRRVTEFATRFSRNYLYNLTRCVADARRHACAALSNVKVTTNRRLLALHMRAVEEKLIDAYQLLLHALAAYCKHIPCSVLNGSPGKLENVLQLAMALQNICEETQLNTTYFGGSGDDATSVGKDMADRCTEILCKSRANTEKKWPTPDGTCSLAARNKERSNRKDKAARYSMYMEESRSTCDWKSRIGVQRTRKPMPVSSVIEENGAILSADSAAAAAAAASEEDAIRYGAVRRKKLQKEDDIKTMMGTLTIDSDERTLLRSYDYASMSTREGEKRPSEKNTCYKKLGSPRRTAKRGENVTLPKEHFPAAGKSLGNLVPVVADLMSLMKSEHERTKRTPALPTPAFPTPLKSAIGIPQEHESLRRTSPATPNSTRGGSLFAGKSYGEAGVRDNNARPVCPSTERNVAYAAASQYCEVSHEETNYESIGATALVGQGRNVEGELVAGRPTIRLSVAEKTRMRLTDYRTEYQRLAGLRSMYVSKTQNKPWEIVAWISDTLVDELIAEIAEELEMNELIQKLLDLEFRNC